MTFQFFVRVELANVVEPNVEQDNELFHRPLFLPIVIKEARYIVVQQGDRV